MHMRKPLAMIAALATLLGGMAFGATSAQAANETTTDTGATTAPTAVDLSKTTITLQGSDSIQQFYKSGGYNGSDAKTNLRDFQYVELAKYVDNGKGGVTLQTLVDKQQVAQAFSKAGITGYDSSKESDPFAWLGQKNFSDSNGANYVNADTQKALAEALSDLATNKVADLADGKVTANEANKSVTFDFGEAGLYLIIDTTTGTVQTDPSVQCSRVWGKVSNVLIGTKLDDSIKVNNATGDMLIQLGTGGAEVKQEYTDSCSTKVNFKKIGVGTDANALKDAVFTIKKLADKDAIVTENNFDAVFGGTDTTIKLDTFTGSATSAANGTFSFDNLAPGKYVIKETTTPSGYLSQYAARLVLTVTQTTTDNTSTITYELTEIGGNGLLQTGGDGTTDKPYVYKNIQNITQLPKTGAAGIALFVAVAVLLLGSAGAVYVKSRRTKAMLR